MAEKYLIEMEGIDKSFTSNQVLKNVSLNIKKGEVHALLGENGAGKSTLMKILAGIHPRDQGVIRLNGKEVVFNTPKEAEKEGIVVIHQELNIIPCLTVLENMFLGREIKHKGGVLKKNEMRELTTKSLERLGVGSIDPDELASNLSVGQQQMVEIARSIATDASLIIMDEPTAALTDRETESLFEVINGLRDDGVSMIYISHRLEEIFEICDTITVLRDGEYIGTDSIDKMSHDRIVTMMVGRELGMPFPERKSTIGDVVFEVKGLTSKGAFENVSFDVKAGEVFGIAGLMGAGRSEIVETIFGHRIKTSGSVRLNGQELSVKHPKDAIDAGIGFITEDRKDKGLLIESSIRENIALTNLERVSTKGVISTSEEIKLAEELFERLGVRATGIDQTMNSLSGGNQQKVVIAKWLGIDLKLLILDEPTRGVDIGAKKEIYTIINKLSESGVAIIVISSELLEVLGISDRIMVMHEGRVSKFVNTAQTDQEEIMKAATGGDLNERKNN